MNFNYQGELGKAEGDIDGPVLFDVNERIKECLCARNVRRQA